MPEFAAPVKWKLKRHDDDEDFWTALCNCKRRKHKAAQSDFDWTRRKRSGGEASAETMWRLGVWDPCENTRLSGPRTGRKRKLPNSQSKLVQQRRRTCVSKIEKFCIQSHSVGGVLHHSHSFTMRWLLNAVELTSVGAHPASGLSRRLSPTTAGHTRPRFLRRGSAPHRLDSFHKAVVAGVVFSQRVEMERSIAEECSEGRGRFC